MNILWVTWKDNKNPFAGGAEVLNEEHAKRLVRDGHKVIILTSGFPGCKHKETISGYSVVRVGNRFTVYIRAMRYYIQHLKEWPDLIIEEINTMPFMTQWYSKKKRVLYIYQLCREIWFHEIIFPLNRIGYMTEPLFLRLLSNNKVLTESESTKQDLEQYGFRDIHIIPVGIPETADSPHLQKYTQPTVLSLGTMRSMKQTIDQVKAFEIAKKKIPSLKMKVAGSADTEYGQNVLDYIASSPYSHEIEYVGRVDAKTKLMLMRKSHIITVTSVKEGWGLIVTEAGRLGTPAVVYNADGLRDSVKHNQTGLVCKHNSPGDLAACIIKLIKNKKNYKIMQKNAIAFNKSFTFENAYREFKKALQI